MKNQKEDKPINEVNGDEAFNFPPGYRFMPRDQELVVSYLKPKVLNLYLPPNVILEVELYRFNPDQLAELFKPQEENTWYFFTPRDRKYRNGDRPNRAAGDGYWKATGADKAVMHGKSKVGFRKALVFYKGKAPNGSKTDWIMHEYRLNNPPKRERAGINDMKLDDWVLCRIYKKAGKLSKGSRSSQPREDSDDKIETEESIVVTEDDTVTTIINPPNSSDVNGYSNLQANEIPPVNTYQASTFNYHKYMRYSQSPLSMLRDDGISAEYEDNNEHFSAQVSNVLLPQEPAIFPHYNNIVYGNCSLQATGMQHFNCCDNVATYSQNHPQSLPAAAVPPPQTQSHNFHLFGPQSHNFNRFGQSSTAPLLQRQLIPVPNSNPMFQNHHPGYYNAAAFQNPVYQFGVEGSIANPAGSSTPISQSSVNNVKVEPASASSSHPTKQSTENHMKKNEEHFNPPAANEHYLHPKDY
ncbi:hypothetical protein LWI28_016438 [Acer negundo]|uniref:NAC domain-containing protein n=1 Tax=Acer negundo TaxID=4023 RepID=A0AAD5NZS1_ACENE|nr:hypothetical protein LWI28_016438 [Acer negundo]KAK4853342.1 hypothetical protein QYF36_007570 [Acer negundo]